VKFDKNELSQPFKRYRRSKVSQGIECLNFSTFSLRFTGRGYEIICLYYFDSVFHKFEDILWGFDVEEHLNQKVVL